MNTTDDQPRGCGSSISRRLRIVLLMVCACGLLASPVRAEQSPREVFTVLFGDALERVKRTPSREDDVRFAQVLLDSADDLADRPAVRLLCYETAAEVASRHPSGFETAMAAAAARIKADESDFSRWLKLLVGICRQRLRFAEPAERAAGAVELAEFLTATGDALAEENRPSQAVLVYRQALLMLRGAERHRLEAVQRKIDAAERAIQLESQIAQLRAIMARGGNAAQARLLVHLLVGGQGDYEAAGEWATQTDDAELVQRVARGDAEPGDLEPAAAVDQGLWWQEMSDSLPADEQYRALKRARAFLLSGIERSQEGVEVVNARVAARLVEAKMEQMLRRGLVGGLYRVVIYNQHNGGSCDRGTSSIDVAGYAGNALVFAQQGLPMDWAQDADPHVVVAFQAPRLDRLRVTVTAYQGVGGGLSEIEVYRDGQLISRGRPVQASGSWSAAYRAELAVDGILTSQQSGQGYWLLPDRQTGWVEINLTGEVAAAAE